MHISTSEIKAIKLVLCNISTVLVITKYICMQELQNMNYVILVALHKTYILSYLYLKLALHKIKMNIKVMLIMEKFNFSLLRMTLNSKLKKYHDNLGDCRRKRKALYHNTFNNIFTLLLNYFLSALGSTKYIAGSKDKCLQKHVMRLLYSILITDLYSSHLFMFISCLIRILFY